MSHIFLVLQYLNPWWLQLISIRQLFSFENVLYFLNLKFQLCLTYAANAKRYSSSFLIEF